MKRIAIFFVIALFSINIFAQDQQVQMLRVLESNDTITSAEQDTTILTKEAKSDLKQTSKDSTRIRFGKKEIMIIEKDGTTTIEIPDSKNHHSFDSTKDKDFTYKRSTRFRGHWAGFEWGFNGYMDPNQSINMQDDLKYLELKQGRSWNFNINIIQYSLGFGTDKLGLVTGLGFEFSNYHFRNETTLKVEDGKTVVDNSYLLDPEKTVTISKFSMTYLTAPLLLEFQIPTSDRHRVFLSAGVVGGVHLSSKTKVEYEGVNEGKDEIKKDFNLSPFRYGLTARVGYRGLSVFATYYPVQLFELNKGDVVYPFAIGLRLLNFGGS